MVEVVDLKKCSGCLLCGLACSFFNTEERAFSLSGSMIRVLPAKGEERFDIEFSEDCNQCGICIDYCHYGVLA